MGQPTRHLTLSLTGAAGDLWSGAWPSGLLCLQFDAYME